MKMTREQVQQLIAKERDYQDSKWGRLEDRPREVGTWITLLGKFITDAQIAYCCSVGDMQALSEIRKVAALAFACLEQHGAPSRRSEI